MKSYQTSGFKYLWSSTRLSKPRKLMFIFWKYNKSTLSPFWFVLYWISNNLSDRPLFFLLTEEFQVVFVWNISDSMYYFHVIPSHICKFVSLWIFLSPCCRTTKAGVRLAYYKEKKRFKHYFVANNHCLYANKTYVNLLQCRYYVH